MLTMFSNKFITRGHMPNPMSIDKVDMLETFVFDRKRKQVVREIDRKRRIIVDKEIVVTT